MKTNMMMMKKFFNGARETERKGKNLVKLTVCAKPEAKPIKMEIFTLGHNQRRTFINVSGWQQQL